MGSYILVGCGFTGALGLFLLVYYISQVIRTIRDGKPKRKQKRVIGYLGRDKEVPIYEGWPDVPEVFPNWDKSKKKKRIEGNDYPEAPPMNYTGYHRR